MYNLAIFEYMVYMLYPKYSWNALFTNEYLQSLSPTLCIIRHISYTALSAQISTNSGSCVAYCTIHQIRHCLSLRHQLVQYHIARTPRRLKFGGWGQFFHRVIIDLPSPISFPSLIVVCSITQNWNFLFSYFNWLNNKQKKKLCKLITSRTL